ncbi:hypothetical protein AAG906_026067 [Vitis piasezkii]
MRVIVRQLSIDRFENEGEESAMELRRVQAARKPLDRQMFINSVPKKPLTSAYGLAKHRDDRWEWAIAPAVSPSPRYQHATIFVNARLHVSGGALGGGRCLDAPGGDVAVELTGVADMQLLLCASHAAADGGCIEFYRRLHGRYGSIDERTRQIIPEATRWFDCPGTPIAPSINGDMYLDISTENAML